MHLIFCININIKIFYKLIPSLLTVIAGHVQITQNKKFVISLQYLKKEGRYEVDFLNEDNHQAFLQDDTISFGGHGQLCLKYLR